MNKRISSTAYLSSLSASASFLWMSFSTAQFRVEFSDGAWIMDGRIYGFPFPYTYRNTVSSLQETIILPAAALDFALTLAIVLALLAGWKHASPRSYVNLRSPHRWRKTKNTIVLAAALVLASKALFAFVFETDLSYDWTYYGDEFVFETISFGFRP